MFCEQCQSFWKEVTSKVQIPDVIESCKDIRWTAHESTLHETIRDLKRAFDLRCRLCRVIYATPTIYEHDALLKDHNERLQVVLKIETNNGPYPVLYAEFREAEGNGIRIPRRQVASCSGLLSDDELVTALDRSMTSENDHTGSDGALELAKYWKDRCLTAHENCRASTPRDSASFVPTRLLDVSEGSIRLIESESELQKGSDTSFVALSHCWGLIPIIRTLKSNYEDHRKSIAPEKLSKTFREAIHATHKLGYRYIWIDSLCIIQDDGDDWSREAETMCDVYQCAVLTIAAAHAPGGDVGCFMERDGLLYLPFYIELPQTDTTKPPVRVQFTSFGRISAVGGGDPALFGRAWVLQEQLLSPRMLMFDGDHISWECLTTYGSENSPTSGTTRHALYHKSIRTGIMDDYEFFDHRDADDNKIQSHSWWARLKYQYWCCLVMDYTHRGMTKSKDRLVALAGIAKALERHTTSEYRAGLWSQQFAIGLLWYIAHNEKFQVSSVKAFDVESNERVRHEEDLAPSWSWASVTAPVMYAQNEVLNYDPVCQVIDITVSGTANKQSGSAEIRGHVRRGYVNPVYPYSIREALVEFPHMTGRGPTGRIGLEYSNFKGRLFHPVHYFLFSETNPVASLKNADPSHVSRKGNFRFMRGSFTPDELIDPGTEITFIAIAQHHFGPQLTSLLYSSDEDAALKVTGLALIPSEPGSNKYKRVGLAVWDHCAWYGYLCGWKDERDRRVYRPSNLSEDGFRQDDTWWDWLARKLWWDDLEALDECKPGTHNHRYNKGSLPELEKYHPSVKVEEEVLVIV